ncbi:MAG: hypothetical protein JOZ69_14940 [Myxococcales bacterium]|nr:hypothetical protein [Myxococcales bacterium]
MLGAVTAVLLACGSRTGLSSIGALGSDVRANVVSDAAAQAGGRACPPIYLIDDTNTLLTFQPLAGAFTVVGTISCVPSGAPVTAFATDDAGTGYLIYGSGTQVSEIRVDMATAVCTLLGTMLLPRPLINGLSFAGSAAAGTERLYVLVADATSIVALESVVLPAWNPQPIGPLVSPIGLNVGASGNGGFIQLMGTTDGSLFALASEPPPAPDYEVLSVETKSGRVQRSAWTARSPGTPFETHVPTASALCGSTLFVFAVDPEASSTVAVSVPMGEQPPIAFATIEKKVVLAAGPPTFE